MTQPAAGLLLLALTMAWPALAEPVSRRQVREWTRLLASEDPQRRVSAATSLLSADDPLALEALQAALRPGQPEPFRLSVITAFGVRGDDRAVAQIIEALGDASENVRSAAAAALQSMDTPAACAQMVKTATDPKRPAPLRAQVVNILGEVREMETIPALIGLLGDADDGVRKAARSALERITLRNFATVQEWNTWWKHSSTLSRPDLLEDLVALQNDRIRTMRQVIEKLYIARIAERKDRNDPAMLLEAIAESESPNVKLVAIRELKDLRSKPVTDTLVTSLNDSDPAVRIAAAETLGVHADPSSAEPLIKLLEDSVVPVRVAAAKALAAMKVKEAVAPLVERLSDPAPEAAAAAAAALGELADPAALDALIKTVTTPTTPGVLYEAAARALARIRDPRAVPTLIKLLESPKETVRWSAVDALGDLKAEGAVGPLSTVALKDMNAQIREAALAALSRIGDGKALDPILASLTDENKRIADQALRSLLALGSADATIFGAAIDRLITARNYAPAEQVLASALEQIARAPNHVEEAAGLRYRLARGLLGAQEWEKARAHLETLIAKTPNNAAYRADMVTCMFGLKDYDAALVVLAQARRNVPDQAENWWKQTVAAVEQLAAARQHAKVIAVVDSLEKESAELGGAANAARLRELRTQAKNTPAVPAAVVKP